MMYLFTCYGHWHVFISSKFNMTGGCTFQMYISSKFNILLHGHSLTSQRLWDCHYARFQDMSKLLLFHKGYIYNSDQLKSFLLCCISIRTKLNKVKKLRKIKVGFYLFMSPEEHFNAVTTSILWKTHGSFY